MSKNIAFFLAAVVAALSVERACAAIVYSQDFANGTGSTIVMNSIDNTTGWSSTLDPGVATTGSGLVTPLATMGSDPVATFPTANGSDGTPGYIFNQLGQAWGTAGDSAIFLNKASVSIDRDAWNLTSITFDNRNDSVVSQRVVLEIAGQLYASSTEFTTASETWTPQSLDMTTATWVPLTLDATDIILGGTAGALPAGDVTGVGVTVAMVHTGNFRQGRVDAYTINADAIPEPATLSLLITGVILSLRTRRHQSS